MTPEPSEELLDKVSGALDHFVEELIPGSGAGAKISELWRLAMDLAIGMERLVPDGEDRDAALGLIAEALKSCSTGIVRGLDAKAGDG